MTQHILSLKYINRHLKSEYGIPSVKVLFGSKYNIAVRKRILRNVVKAFTGYEYRKGQFSIYNPYTNTYESLKLKSLTHIQSKEDLMQELKMLKRTRTLMLKRSRRQIIKLVKSKNRDADLDASIEQQRAKASELKQIRTSKTNARGIDR